MDEMVEVGTDPATLWGPGSRHAVGARVVSCVVVWTTCGSDVRTSVPAWLKFADRSAARVGRECETS